MSDKTTTNSEQQCQYLDDCVVWKKFSTNSKLFWMNSYCRGPKQDQCVRKQQKTQREFIPDELLPNGTFLNVDGAATISECENLKNCAVWKKFQSDNKMFWIKAYCQGPKRSDCVRKQRSSQGLSVADDLLPNGETL